MTCCYGPGGLLSISFLQLPTIRKNMRREAEEQIYARIMEARIRLENTETFTKMAQESPKGTFRIS